MNQRQKFLNTTKRIFCFIMAAVMVFFVSLCAYAEDKNENHPLDITVTTDKTEYKVHGIATITATVMNTGDRDIHHISAKAIFNDLAPVKGGSTNVESDTLKPGEALSFTYKATLNKSAHNLTIFQKIMLFIVRLFNGGYTANNSSFDDGRKCTEQIDSFTFGGLTAKNTIKVWYEADESDEAEFAGGDGTELNPYQVATPAQLNAVRNHLDSFFIQTSDIDMSKWGSWEPIGKAVPAYATGGSSPKFEEQLFSGNYNGNSYKISNLTIQNEKVSPHYDCYGLFAGAEDAIIKNIYLENITFDIDKVSTDYVQIYKNEKLSFSVCVGGILGKIDPDCELINCTVSGKISVLHSKDSYVGGIVGYGNAEKCKNYTDIFVYSNRTERYDYSDSQVNCGGIAGYANGKISNCSNHGNITATAGNFLYAGGITGKSLKEITECVNTGTISGKRLFGKSTTTISTDCAVGGISGHTSGNIVSWCINYGEIFAFSYKYITNAGISVGGICGTNANSGASLVNCYNKTKCIKAEYAEDQENTQAWAGRITGFGSKSENCFSSTDTIVTGNTRNYNIDGKDLLPDDFLNESSYIDFDFENTWKIDPEIGGAVLR